MSDIQTQSSPAKVALPFGILFGILIIFIMFSLYFYDVNLFEDKTSAVLISLLTNLVLPILFIFLAVKQYKQKPNDGFLSIGQALKIGISLMIIAGIISGIYNILFNHFVPEYMEQSYEFLAATMKKDNPSLTTEQIESTISIQKKFSSPWIVFPLGLVVMSFIGLIYSLIIGAIFKKERPIF